MSTEFPFDDSYVHPPWDDKPAYPYCAATSSTPDTWAKKKGAESFVVLREGYSARVYGAILSRFQPPRPGDGDGIFPINPELDLEARLNWWKSSSETPIVEPRRIEYRTTNDTGVSTCLEYDAQTYPLGEDTIVQPWLISKRYGIDWHPSYSCGVIDGTSLWVVRLTFLGGLFRAWIVAGKSIDEVRRQTFRTHYLFPGSVFNSDNGCLGANVPLPK